MDFERQNRNGKGVKSFYFNKNGSNGRYIAALYLSGEWKGKKKKEGRARAEPGKTASARDEKRTRNGVGATRKDSKRRRRGTKKGLETAFESFFNAKNCREF